MSDEKLPPVPPGYELAAGWVLAEGSVPAPSRWLCTFMLSLLPEPHSCGNRALFRAGGSGLCRLHSLIGGAIVRKADAPTCKPWCGVNLPIHHGCVAGTCWALLAPNGDWHFDSEACRDAGRPLHPAAEQPSGNTGGLPTCEKWGDECASSSCLDRRAKAAEAPAAPVAEPMHAPKDCPLARHLHVDNRGKVPLCDSCVGHDPKRDRIAALEAELAEAKAATSLAREALETYVADSNRHEAAAVQAERERCASLVEEFEERLSELTSSSLAPRVSSLFDDIRSGRPAP